MTDPLIDIRRLSKTFGPITAVDDITFAVRRGEVLGFLGPNGAGKSTTMKMVTGYLPPTRGTALVCGHDVVVEPIAVKRRVGYLPEGAPAYGDMTPDSFLSFVADVRGLTGAVRKRRLADVIERLHLESVLRQPVETLSKGFRRRVGLAQAILNDPEVLILDEPTDGLDPNQKHEVRALLSQMAGDKAIVISTHILEEVEAVCTRAVIIGGGRILADARPDELQARSRYHKAVALRLPAAKVDEATRLLRALPGVSAVEAEGTADAWSRLTVFPNDSQDLLGPVREVVTGNGINVAEIYLERGRLDEVFRSLTEGTEAHAAHA